MNDIKRRVTACNVGRKMSESGSLGTSSTGSDATTDPFSQLLASMARPIPCVTGIV
ncbi:hypothetical protein WUBG_00189 [Wuchereria bancrofti]|uniref:Uncharacterized protein n=1 Tax=Wuchereria bancrofti TaxID=6293 RepID=J9F304_WUCBA|nr:hypothetical protein WUBG_00189 [Wuchereria bancrofti]VDM14079.1 unnamed protein product [Wuchereria bancrofti]